MIRASRFAKHIQHIVRVIIAESESVAAVPRVGFDAVVESARFAHHGYRAVTRRDHLRKPAGFCLGRHQEDIAAGIDLSRKIGVERDHGNAFSLITAREVREIIFIRRVALA